MSRRSFRRVAAKCGGPLKACPECGVVLLTAAELAGMLDKPHSTIALRLRKAGVGPVATEGARDLYLSAQVIPILIRGDS